MADPIISRATYRDGSTTVTTTTRNEDGSYTRVEDRTGPDGQRVVSTYHVDSDTAQATRTSEERFPPTTERIEESRPPPGEQTQPAIRSMSDRRAEAAAGVNEGGKEDYGQGSVEEDDEERASVEEATSPEAPVEYTGLLNLLNNEGAFTTERTESQQSAQEQTQPTSGPSQNLSLPNEVTPFGNVASRRDRDDARRPPPQEAVSGPSQNLSLPDSETPFGNVASSKDRDRAAGRGFFPGDKEVDLVSDEQSEFTVKTKEKGDTSPADATDPKTVAKKKAEEANAKAKAESEAAAKRNANRQARPYIPTYYSGTQAQIYFHDVLVDEINYFQYNVITNRAPIYGYASELFDAVARGNKIIQGSFSINFIEANYIPIIAASLNDYDINVNRRTSKHYNFGTEPTLAHDITYDTLEFNSELNPDSYLGKQVVNQVQSLGNKEFREISRQMNINKFQRDGSFTNRTNKPLYADGTTLDQFENIGPFDIYMVFGDYTDSEADHTVRCIKDVFLIGQGQTVVADGNPVAENYTFIARDIE